MAVKDSVKLRELLEMLDPLSNAERTKLLNTAAVFYGIKVKNIVTVADAAGGDEA